MADITVSDSTLNRKGVELEWQGDLDGAALHYRAVLSATPGFVPAMVNLASALRQKNQVAASITLTRRVLAVTPGDGNQWSNLGMMLMGLERFEDAARALGRAAELIPESPALWHNKALLAHRMGRWAEAEKFLDQIEALGSRSTQVQNDRAHMVLAAGRDLQLGLELYEARWEQMTHLPPWDFHIPEWKGQDLRGKTILVHNDMGFGDGIMASRCVSEFTSRGATVVLGLPSGLVSLYEHQEWPQVRVISIDVLESDDVQGVDYHTPFYSALRWLGVTWESISPAPYLVPPKLTTQPTIPGFLNVGICWASGRRGGKWDWRRRVAPLELFLTFAENPRVQLYSLQKGAGEEDISTLGAEGIVQEGARYFTDWADTAAFIAKLNLVITVDTAVAHLAAAMGIETWMLSHYSHCWRWVDIANGTGRPWYSCMKIFRQPEPKDWEGVVALARAELDRRLGR